MKECLECKNKKPLNEFYKDKTRKHGYTYKCKLCIRIQNQVYYSKNKEEHNLRNIKWQCENVEKQQRYSKKSYLSLKTTPDWLKNKYKYNNSYQKLKYNDNPNFKIIKLIRNRFMQSLKHTNKSTSSILLLGCSIEEFKLYLEQQFKSEMNWENHGIVWEIDHIKACANFDLKDIEQQKECFHYTNMQPLFKTTEIAEQHGYQNEIGNRNKSKF
jgi:hypothetical protein